ncbi:MAG: acetylglucosaminyldiphosphoundecaprenol acetyl-beta-D-mannosaminyltransferase [Patescibacteria group bacterium]|nr:MAG: acetylglucosaminyldiphosphoundecaprenol acetyl-beta-D-mannosaminyltransferase [Patescibacteria group bacterium]
MFKELTSVFSLLKSDKFLDSYESVLYLINKGRDKNRKFTHIVSINPEIMVLSFFNKEFRGVIRKAQFLIADGVGVVVAAKILYNRKLVRVTGSGLIEKILNSAKIGSFRVLLIGGRPGLAKKISDCYNSKSKKIFCLGIEGIKDIKNVKKKEIKEIKSIVSSFKPHIVFLAFGSPNQEIFAWRYRDLFDKNIVVGVGGGFDYLGGVVPRAPKLLRKYGLEWLFRLIVQPKRVFRQARLLVFVLFILILYVYYSFKKVFGNK